MKTIDKSTFEGQKLLSEIRQIMSDARNQIARTVNTAMLFAYWNIGKSIVERQGGEGRAQYGDHLIIKISQSMVAEFGKGFSSRNLRSMRTFYLTFPIWQTVSAKLTWSHYIEIIRLENKDEQTWYLTESKKSNWSVRQLQRAISTSTYNRIVSHKEVEYVDSELICLACIPLYFGIDNC